MATYESDEEQIEALASWWKENGNSLIIGVIVVLVVLFSSRQWQSTQTESAELASDLYQQMADLTAVGSTAEASDENFNQVLSNNTELRNEHTKSVYSHFSALLMARVYVERDDLDMAVSELNWILDNPDIGFMQSLEEQFFLTARLRLARVILAQGEAQTALNTLSAVEPGSFVGGFAEVEGDAYMALGRVDDARRAYQLAIETASNPALLQLKLEDLPTLENN